MEGNEINNPVENKPKRDIDEKINAEDKENLYNELITARKLGINTDLIEKYLKI